MVGMQPANSHDGDTLACLSDLVSVIFAVEDEMAVTRLQGVRIAKQVDPGNAEAGSPGRLCG